MANDPEQQLYTDMADLTEKVPKLQNEIKSLKAKLTKLSGRIESLELMAFQEQISSLNDKMKSISESLLAASRRLARFEMEFLQYHVRGVIRDELSGPECERVREYIAKEYARAEEKLVHSSEPLSILRDFRKVCTECSKEYNLGAFGK